MRIIGKGPIETLALLCSGVFARHDLSIYIASGAPFSTPSHFLLVNFQNILLSPTDSLQQFLTTFPSVEQLSLVSSLDRLPSSALSRFSDYFRRRGQEMDQTARAGTSDPGEQSTSSSVALST